MLEDGTVIPPANLTDLPFCQQLRVKNLSAHLRPHKMNVVKVDTGPFLFTPIHFNSIDRRTKKNDGKICKLAINLYFQGIFTLKKYFFFHSIPVGSK